MNVSLDYDAVSWGETYPVRPTNCKRRSVFLLAPNSYLGVIYLPLMAAQLENVVAVVDDQSSSSHIHGFARWSSDTFSTKAGQHKDALAVDLSCSPMGNAVFGKLIEEARIERADLVQLLAELNLPAVYQTPSQMRELTIARQHDWWQLRASLADDASRQTLDAILLLRLSFDRRHLRRVATSPEDEYFSLYSSDATFRLSHDEIFCDAGAYVGSTVRKVVAATGGSFREIHAFEPDRKNFNQLKSLSSLPLDRIHLHNSAVGDYTGRIRFLETGTMGSHVDVDADNDGGETPVTRLDDAVEKVTFIKMDLEGFETRALKGAARLVREFAPRLAITGYHYADDLLDIAQTIRGLRADYSFRLRHHSNYYYDSILYAESDGMLH